MRLRSKIFLPILCASILLVAYISGLWLPRTLADDEADLRSEVGRHIESVADGLVPLLLGRQLDAIHGNLDTHLKTNQGWAGIELFDAQARQLYPLDAAQLPERHKLDDVRILKQDIRYLDTHIGTLVVKVCFTERLAAARDRYLKLIFMFWLFTSSTLP